MFRKLLVLFFSVALFTVAHAQLSYGIKGGVTESYISETPVVDGADNTLQTGLQVGVFVEKTIAPKTVFRPALQLTQKGYKSVAGNVGGPFYWSRNLTTSYIEVPLDVLHKFTISNNSNFFVATGPVISYGLYGQMKASVVSTDDNNQLHTQNSTYKDIFKRNTDRRFDLGWDVNIGVQSCRMLFSATYNHGITDVTKDEHQSLKNRSFAICVGYLLR